ncbi:hypothetical protein [Methylobacterium sp. E-066]|uniref:hypothetical protein n=1 Tax=Methylobacterium sp. E-066 TaxID=2836584 RepID=UPI001FBA69A1|nr:hypothetical protein [Methylobacterium sp. E-066]MCJ2139477.1 hypothetical protein [Methylobacterium sp. E-066]
MSETEDPVRVEQILRMSTALAEQFLIAQASGGPFDEKHIEAVTVAARFLLENELPWPPVVGEAIEVLAGRVDEVKAISTAVEP